MKKKIIVVWFSCGAPSAVASKMTIDEYGKEYDVMVVYNPVDEESEDNKRFLKDVSKWIGQEIIEAKNTKIGTTSAVEIWEKRKYMSGIKGAPCTMLLKKGARYEFELKHDIAFHVLGFTLEEKDRHIKFTTQERSNVIPVLIDNKVTRYDCFDIIQDAGIKLPEAYLLGMPNNNCFGCVKSQSPTYWNLIRRIKPAVFKLRAEQSRRLGVKLVKLKGKRIFLDELPENAKGGKIKSYDCGIFCDTE